MSRILSAHDKKDTATGGRHFFGVCVSSHQVMPLMGTAARPATAKDTVFSDVNRLQMFNEAARGSVCFQIIQRNYLMHPQNSEAPIPHQRRQRCCRRLASKGCKAPLKCLTASNHSIYLTWMTDIITVLNKLLM